MQGDHLFQDGKRIDAEAFPAEAHARAVVESQLLSIRARLIDTLHTTTSASKEAEDQTFASSAGLKRCIITGGGSHNPVLQQLASDILGLPVYTATNGGDSAAHGGALLAKYAWWKHQHGESGTSFEDMRREMGDVLALEQVAKPSVENEHLYGRLLNEFRHCEQIIVGESREDVKAVEV